MLTFAMGAKELIGDNLELGFEEIIKPKSFFYILTGPKICKKGQILSLKGLRKLQH